MDFSLQITYPSSDYELLDSGAGEKLERYGSFTVARPDPQALWDKQLSSDIWNKADAVFVRRQEKGEWNLSQQLPERWFIGLAGLKMWIKPTSFKHTGIFPEQAENWTWITHHVRAARAMQADRQIKVLNLFGYTGGATLAAARGGAEVTHVDSSKSSVTWAKENAELSGLTEASIRWIVDDARDFIKREIKRGNVYDAIIMDPPAFGRGADKQVWKIEEHLPELLSECKRVLSKEPLFFLINGYASGYSAIAYKNSLEALMRDIPGELQYGEVAIAESPSLRLLPAGIFARWSRST